MPGTLSSIVGDTRHWYLPSRARRVPMCHAFMQLLGGTRFGPEPGACVSLLHPHSIPLPGTKGPLERSGHAQTGREQWKMHQMIPPSPFHLLPSCLVDSWPSQCGLGRLIKFPSKTTRSQEQELPQAISVPGYPFKGFLDRRERLWPVGSQGRRPIVVSDFWLGSYVQTVQFPN